ncbi:hypothetical protein OBBRIDRAFT_238839 [Obba rivulosa]|uniref:RBR-type E3 ubiquitin transferase n=1 Tax=Obba rivulosa TaxID=1052685 RepID=A0A8E2J5T4_9APHY|nr:hypothetical protein OBBRIDRAFT_238839 [Obba rivulosa]
MALRLAQEAPGVETIRMVNLGATGGGVAPVAAVNSAGDPRPRQPVQGQNAQKKDGRFSSVVNTVYSWFASHEIPSPQANEAQTLAAPTTQTKAPTRPSGYDCAICLHDIIGVDIRTPCGHHYDKGCILNLFERSTKDETVFPPRCCKRQIPLSSVQAHMSADLLQRFNTKLKECSTLKRVYCANPVCSRFLGPQQGSTTSRSFLPSSSTTKACPAAGCITTTCLRCKNKVTNPAHRCTENVQDSQVLSLGRAAGWARCPGCETMIELKDGCLHITCRCRTEFCYVCKARWKTCKCLLSR